MAQHWRINTGLEKTFIYLISLFSIACQLFLFARLIHFNKKLNVLFLDVTTVSATFSGRMSMKEIFYNTSFDVCWKSPDEDAKWLINSIIGTPVPFIMILSRHYVRSSNTQPTLYSSAKYNIRLLLRQFYFKILSCMHPISFLNVILCFNLISQFSVIYIFFNIRKFIKL